MASAVAWFLLRNQKLLFSEGWNQYYSRLQGNLAGARQGVNIPEQAP